QPREVAEDADPLEPATSPCTHLLGLRVAQEVAAETAVALVDADADEHRPGGPDEPGAGRPAEDSGRRLVRIAGASRPVQHLDGDGTEAGVHQPTQERREAVETGVGALASVA